MAERSACSMAHELPSMAALSLNRGASTGTKIDVGNYGSTRLTLTVGGERTFKNATF